MSTRNTAIFDLDGTLLNSLQDLTNSVNYCMKKYGGPSYTCEEIRNLCTNRKISATGSQQSEL